ncbi:uncharacterized protein N0V89_008112 [Didymosphaeria variabile]|uniref:F-box domain-containing protein n=1 Tax=Didymosphaeria variabile TaxID=1932322 RepID=A0A9W8XF47_9PLEO|nr:uncharacterized protein N0V89_008112 [Didymosphaeria variabile]KAJ4349496.1 hypothetical protein N0V89_008112 [Didymosphaeria variabile]
MLSHDNSTTSSWESVVDEGAQRHHRNALCLEEGIYKSTYEVWKDGDNMRLEDENLLAACSEPFSIKPERQTQSSKLLDLPAELQNEILHSVDRSDFKALLQTCVALRAAVMPLILEHVVMSGNSPRFQLVVDTLEATISKSKEVANIIRHLQLPDDDTNSDILSRLLPLTTKIKSLHYGYVVHEGPADNDVIDARHLSSMLAPIQHTLTTLKVTYVLDLNECDAGGQPCVEGWLRVKDMLALKKLETTFTILFGPSKKGIRLHYDPPAYAEGAPRLSDVLPPGLVELRILSDPWEYDPAGWNTEQRVEVISEYVCDRNWEQFTPDLRLLNYNMDSWRDVNSMDKEIVAAQDALAELIRKNGLEWALELSSTPQITNLFFVAQDRYIEHEERKRAMNLQDRNLH